jgi:hypothetical protein
MGVTSAAASGISTFNGGTNARNFCNRLWKDVDVPGVHGQQAKVLNDDFGSVTCLNNSGNLGFDVTRSTAFGEWTEFPNIATGWELSELPRHHQAWKFPVKVSRDGAPWSDVRTGIVRTNYAYNAAYDIWFDQTARVPVPVQANGSEVMIWLQHEHVLSPPPGSPVYEIDGIKWEEMRWITTHNGVSWHYIAFVAVRPHTWVNLWLNPFFRKAEQLDWLSPNWYLTSVDFGFEIVNGGVGLRVNHFRFGGAR